jgi:hypothetical protein
MGRGPAEGWWRGFEGLLALVLGQPLFQILDRVAAIEERGIVEQALVQGIEVFTPSITISSSARRRRMMQPSRVRP